MTIKKYREQRKVINTLIKIQEMWEKELEKNPNIRYEDILKKYFGVNSASKLD